MPNILLCLRGPFRVTEFIMFSCNSQFIWSGSYTQPMTVKQLEIQVESERLLANARQSVLEVASRSTFSRPEWAKTNQIASFQC